MTARCLDAAALTMALAGEGGEGVAAAFDASAHNHLLERVRALRPAGTREQRARVLASAGLRLLAPPRVIASDGTGARFIAAWVRSLDPADRAVFIRGLGASSLAALHRALPDAPVFDPAQRSTATFLVNLAHRTTGHPLPLSAWSSLIEALALRGSLVDASLLRVARVVRMSARADACLTLAAEVAAR